ncbi:hybrid sensor histidine kinase/response regulator [Pseudomonas japonica]|uniref:hybrid sensor histidine kinase/response regulator n=1 Tax=Pseudomonas japonica TaxID=256466 RepID=UPI0015E3658F|nr:PAS domain-containing sensor histidine kinase [Pseudomonas japonica]MBA1245158.1 PAS domain S-box protein [Pseudomonas japonica]
MPDSAPLHLIDDSSRYRLLLDAVTDYAIYMLGPDGHVTSWNTGARRFKGYEEAEILGHHFSRFYTEEDKAAGLPDRALAIAAREGRFENEGWRVRKDGTRFWCHVVIDPIYSSAGAVLGYAKVTRDLTERRLAEQELRRSEQQFRLLVQGVVDYAIYMLDPTGVITNWNAGAQRIKGYLPEEVIGRHFSMFYPAAERERQEPQRGLRTALAEGRFENQGWRVRKDGSTFWANVVIDPIHNEAGELIGFAKVTRDITESREKELALEQAREALFQSQKMESLGQLTGGIAHDFNNLLMVVLGSLEIVRKRLPHDPRITPLLENAIQGAERGASLTKRMLAFARRQQLSLAQVDLGAVIRGMSELMQSSIGPRIHIETRFPLSIRPVMADSNQLELAVLNLAVNARDAMPDGGTLTIELHERAVASDTLGLRAGNYMCLSLRDTGEGMDSATLARATEPFFTTKGIGKGTGLGLSMVHGLCEQSGGKFILHSSRPGGTTAQMWFPVAVGEDSPVCPAQPPSEVTTAVGQRVILAVDDDPLILMSTTAMLEDLGYQVLPAASAEQAMALLEQHGAAIDGLVTDNVMPGLSGVQLIERAHRYLPSLPAVLVSGFGEDTDAASTAVSQLAKPFDQAMLARVLAKLW